MSCWRAILKDLQQPPLCTLRILLLQLLLSSSATATTRLRSLQASPATPEVCYSLYALYSGDGPEPAGPTAWRYSKSECMPIETQLAAALNAAVKALLQPLSRSIQAISGASGIESMAQAFDAKGCILGDEQQGYLGMQVCGSFRSAQDAQALSEWLVYGDNGAVLVNKLTRLGGSGHDPAWCAEEPGGATTASDSNSDASSSGSSSNISMTAACILPAIAVPSNRPPPSTYVFSLTTLIEPRPPWAFVAPEHVSTPFAMSTHV